MKRRVLVQGALAGGAAFLQGCSPLSLINGSVLPGTHRVQAGIAYGAYARLKLDVYRPGDGRAVTQAPAPVVVFFYGGNWDSGERADYLFVGAALAARGFVAVLPDYRLYPEVRFPDFLTDCAQAVRWVTGNIAAYGGNPQQVFLMGHSAGAYNAAMLALNGGYLRAAGVDMHLVRGLIGLAGPYDFLPLIGPVTKAVFGFPDTAITTQPIHFVSAAAPPALLLAAKHDDLVDPGNSARLAARMHANGVAARVITYPRVGHRTLVGALAAPLRSLAPVLEDVSESEFIRARSATRA